MSKGFQRSIKNYKDPPPVSSTKRVGSCATPPGQLGSISDKVCLFQGTFVEAFVQKISPKGLQERVVRLSVLKSTDIEMRHSFVCVRLKKRRTSFLKKTNIKYVN